MPRFAPTPYAPIPGTEPAPRAFFVDRWGTLLERPRKGWCRRFRDARLVADAADALFRASRAGWRIYLLGNEEQVARGEMAPEAWAAFEAELLARLAAEGVAVARCYASTWLPDGVDGQQGDSVYHLPNTGAFYHARHIDRVDLGRSWVVGDSTLELAAGWRAGVRLAGVRTGEGLADGRFDVVPEAVGDDLSGLLRELLSLEGAIQP